MFVVDDLVAWLLGLLADSGRRGLATIFLGSPLEIALRSAAEEALRLTAIEVNHGKEADAAQMAMVLGEVFRAPATSAALAGQGTLLEGLQSAIAAQLSVLDEVGLTGIGRSSSDLLGVSSGELADSLTAHLIREVVERGSGGGPLFPLATQLNHDVTHLQGRQLQSKVGAVLLLLQEGSRDGQRKPAGRPVRLIQPRPVLAGREHLLDVLDTRLSYADGALPQRLVLYGLGGVGKTSLALAYAYRRLADTSVVWQFEAEEPTALVTGFGDLAAQLGVLGTGDPVAQVHAVLAERRGGWLLIFDNASGPAALQGMLPPAGHGQVLVTSRNPDWPGMELEVPVLALKDAARFLMSRTGSGDDVSARQLAAELGGLPLALEQACAYMRTSGRDIAGYLSLLRRRRADILGRGQVPWYGKQVITTWGLAFDRLRASFPQAIGLLRFLACCAPERIPLDLILNPLPDGAPPLAPRVAALLAPLLDDPVAVDDSVAALRQFSLISDPQDRAVSVHRLVQAVTLDQLPEEDAENWQKVAAVLTAAALPGDSRLPATWPVFAALLPHVQATHADDSQATARIAAFLGDSGNYRAARDLQQRITEATERVLGAEHRGTLTARHRLAGWTGDAGDSVAARDQYSSLLRVQERVLGPENPATLDTRSDLAFWTGESGDVASARDQFAALLPVHERVSGAEHPATLATRHHLAVFTGLSGRPAAARDQLAVLLPVVEHVLGQEAHEALDTRAALAFWTGMAGDAAAARDQYSKLLPAQERVQGWDHPETLRVRGDLASWTGKAGDPVTARDLYATLLPVHERAWGPNSPHTLAARANLAFYTGEGGDPAAGRDQYAALIPDLERILGAKHPETIGCRADLARWTGEAGDAAAARDQYAVLLPLMTEISSADHPYTLRIRSGIAQWTGVAGAPGAARDRYAALVPDLERVLGPDHPDTQAASSALIRWNREAGKPK
jgi:hypothetical protein